MSVSPMHIKFMDNKLSNNENVPIEITKNKPDVTLNSIGYSTLIMYDIDVPYPGEDGVFIHWLVVNIPNSNINNGTTVIEYISPNPPEDSKNHRYYIVEYLQSEFIDTNTLPYEFTFNDFIDMINRYGLVLGDTLHFKTGYKNMFYSPKYYQENNFRRYNDRYMYSPKCLCSYDKLEKLKEKNEK